TPNGLTPPPAPQHDPRSRTGGRRAATNLISNNDNAKRSPLASSWKPTQSHTRHRPTRTSSRAAGRRASRAGWTAGTTASPIRRMGHLGEGWLAGVYRNAGTGTSVLRHLKGAEVI